MKGGSAIIRPQTGVPRPSSSAPNKVKQRPLTSMNPGAYKTQATLSSGRNIRIQSTKTAYHEPEGENTRPSGSALTKNHHLYGKQPIGQRPGSAAVTKLTMSTAASLMTASLTSLKTKKKMFFEIGEIKGEMNSLDTQNKVLKTKINILKDEHKKMEKLKSLSEVATPPKALPHDMLEMPKTLQVKRRIDDLVKEIAVLQSVIDNIHGEDEERYRKKSDTIDKLRRDVRTLYLNKLYLDSVATHPNPKDPLPGADSMAAEVRHMEETAKLAMSEFNLLVAKSKKEERIRYLLQKAREDKEFEKFRLKVEKSDLEAYSQQQSLELEDLQKQTGVEEQEQLLENLKDATDYAAFAQKRMEQLENNLIRNQEDVDRCAERLQDLQNSITEFKAQAIADRDDFTQKKKASTAEKQQLLQELAEEKAKLAEMKENAKMKKLKTLKTMNDPRGGDVDHADLVPVEQDGQHYDPGQIAQSGSPRGQYQRMSTIDMRQLQSGTPSNSRGRDIGLHPKKKLKKKRRISHEEIQSISEKLRLSIMDKRIPIEELQEMLGSISINNLVCLRDLQEFLQRPPFEMQNALERELVARYFIEDNSEDKVDFDENACANLRVLQSVLRAFLGAYTILDEHQTHKIEESIRHAVQENARRLQDAFAAVRGQLGQYCGRERFEKCFKMSDIELHSDQLQYIYSVMFAITKDVDLIEFSKFFSRFNIDPNYVSTK